MQFFYINMSSLVINSFKNEINTIILKILRCVGSTSFSHSPLDALLWWYTVLCVSNLSRGGPNLWRASHINITGAYGRTSAVPYSIIYPSELDQLPLLWYTVAYSGCTVAFLYMTLNSCSFIGNLQKAAARTGENILWIGPIAVW